MARALFLFLAVPWLCCGLLSAQPSTKQLTMVRTTTFSGGTPRKSAIGRPQESLEVDVTFDIPGVSGNNSPARLPASRVPTPAGSPFANGTFSGFAGLDQFLQAIAPTPPFNGANGQLEPPDQALAVGNGFVVEAVNSAIAIYDTQGNFLGFEALSSLFGVPPTFVLDTAGNVVGFGPFISDPRAYFDSVNGHFFVTETEIDVDPASGALKSTSHVLIAVSQTGSPAGNWNVYVLDVSDDGDARFGGCPTGCFADQPLIGADGNGFYISTNAFGLPPSNFRGAQLYAVSLAALEGGSGGAVSATHFGNLNAGGLPARSIQPATVSPGGAFETASGGAEYFLSAVDPTHLLDDRVAVWALTNTSSLNSTPNLQSPGNVIVATQVYGFPPSTEQKPGPTPLLDFIASPAAAQDPTFGGTFKNHEELIAANEDRMQQLTFANGMLWSALPSIVKPQGVVRVGAAWFVLAPSLSGGQLSASVVNQGYVAIQSPKQNSVLFPSVGVNASGKAVIAFSIAGQDFFPSAGYVTLDVISGTGPIVISAPGFAPDDGFSGYAPFGFRVARWGDYSAAVSDENGDLWMGNEAILPPLIQFPPGVLLANWGTFITKVPQ
jgi:hypothetical protein